MSNLTSKSFFPKNLFKFPCGNFPSVWDAFEDNIGQLDWDQSGLSLFEDNHKIYIEAKMPGLNVSDIKVTLDNGILRVQGEKKQAVEDKERKYHKKASYSYCYRISLPSGADENSPDASYKDVDMTINIQKLPTSQGKTIPIKNS